MPTKATGGRRRRGTPATKTGVQYTVRSVPPQVDAALRHRARQQHRSLNALLRDALAREAGVSEERLHHDLDALAGAWEDDPDFDAAVAAQDRVDPALWR